jgi:hypothetical protein
MVRFHVGSSLGSLAIGAACRRPTGKHKGRHRPHVERAQSASRRFADAPTRPALMPDLSRVNPRRT